MRKEVESDEKKKTMLDLKIKEHRPPPPSSFPHTLKKDTHLENMLNNRY